MKKIWITGASSGIGAASAKKLVELGHHVWLTGRNESALKTMVEELGEHARYSVLDVRDYNAVSAFVTEFIREWTSLDVLVNNAGLGYFEPLTQGHIEQWHEMIDTNVKGVLNCLHAALPHLIASTGQIINLGSLASHTVFANSGVYCASKHALFAISESIRTELPDKVRVTTISPGSVNTPFIDKTTNEEMLKQYKDYFAAGLPVGVIADQIVHVIEMPMGTNISEIVIRPSRAVR